MIAGLRWMILIGAALLGLSCGSAPEAEPEAADATAALAQALTFFAGFEDGMDAGYARGDRRIYSAASYKELANRSPGYWGSAIEIAYDAGRVGNALRFNEKNTQALFYSAQDNVPFSSDSWSGTVSFWLSLDPATDLEPGYCDPIQVTDSAYNDSAVWVDFTRDNPRQFRLGVFGELTAWNPENTPPDENPTFNDRLVVVEQPPFAKENWTHVAIAYQELGTPQGKATLYLDGVAQGTSSGISEAFEWAAGAGELRLGVNYVGLFDELAVFDRTLTESEVHQIFSLEGSLRDILE